MKFFLVLFLLFLLIGCSSEDKSKLTFMVGGAPNELIFWSKVVKNFEKKTGIEVEILRQPADTEQRRQSLVIALSSHNRDPDVFLMDVIWISQFSASEWLEPLDRYLKNSPLALKLFFEKVVKNIDTYKGKIVALPVYIDG
ncbi:MAG: extracellular solute-binding protein [Thermodesulfobacterium sp.]|nr:extracellular solute-binding protein [Thermodesulfobacterium sp.]